MTLITAAVNRGEYGGEVLAGCLTYTTQTMLTIDSKTAV